MLQKYRRDTAGEFAVITGLVGIPLCLIAAGAIDINRATSKELGLQSAVDTAALAAVIPDNMTDAARISYAKKVFKKNYYGDVPATLTITGNREKLNIVATAKVPTLFSSVVGINYVKVSKKATAILTRSDVVCLLVLDPSGDDALVFQDSSTFKAPACSVQVNSTSPRSMVSRSATTP